MGGGDEVALLASDVVVEQGAKQHLGAFGVAGVGGAPEVNQEREEAPWSAESAAISGWERQSP